MFNKVLKQSMIMKNMKMNKFMNFSLKSFSGCNHELEYIKVEVPYKRVGLITIDRPRAKNALCNQLIEELNHSLYHFESDPNIAVVVLTGHKDFFAAGADIKEMKDLTLSECYKNRFLDDRDFLANFKKPTIACVNGYALGGGCEIALMCDIIVAGDNALFGQPEITIGTIPGMGGSQRLARVIGKSRTMEMCLTGEPMRADEAYTRNLVSRVVEREKSLKESLAIAQKIASYSNLIACNVKDVVNTAYETTLRQGLDYEKRVFWSTFGTDDRKLGMSNFVNKVKDTEFTDN